MESITHGVERVEASVPLSHTQITTCGAASEPSTGRTWPRTAEPHLMHSIHVQPGTVSNEEVFGWDRIANAILHLQLEGDAASGCNSVLQKAALGLNAPRRCHGRNLS